MKPLRSLILPSLVASLSLACGSSSVGVEVTPDAASALSDAGATTDDAAATGGGSTADAAVGADATTLADGGAADLRIDPIEVGRAWTYNVTVLGFYPSCENGLGVATTLSKSVKDGKTAFKVQSLCKNAGTFEYAVQNDRVHYYYLGGWRLATDEPVKAGHEWNDGTYDYEWEDAGTVTVAAGTFSQCFTARRKVAYESYTTFCRGVGPVHWHYEDGLGNGYDAVLASKNF